MVYSKSLVCGAGRLAIVPRSDAAARSLRRVPVPVPGPLSHLHTVPFSRSLLQLAPSSLRHTYFRNYSSSSSQLHTTSQFASRTNLRSRNPSSSNKLSRTQIRSCSYQRHNMCRHSLGADAAAEGAVDVTKGREVLPTNVKPLHYRLTLEPNLESFEYTGTVEIEYAHTYPT